MATKVLGMRTTVDSGYVTDIAANSLDLDQRHVLKYTAGTGLEAAGAGETIVGVSMVDKTYESDNFTVDKSRAIYVPTDSLDEVMLPLKNVYLLDFNGDLITDNKINLKVNGTSMTEVTFTDDNATTLGLIATQLVTDFPALIEAAKSVTASDSVYITPIDGVVISITDIAVTAGVSQATGTFTTPFTYAKEGRYYDLDTTGVDYSTDHASSGQVKLTKYVDLFKGRFKIVNA